MDRTFRPALRPAFLTFALCAEARAAAPPILPLSEGAPAPAFTRSVPWK